MCFKHNIDILLDNFADRYHELGVLIDRDTTGVGIVSALSQFDVHNPQQNNEKGGRVNAHEGTQTEQEQEQDQEQGQQQWPGQDPGMQEQEQEQEQQPS